MNVTLSYDEEFSELLAMLKDKYGEAIFEIEGIGSQLDLNKFSKNFFNTKTTSDVSIDANANVGDSTVISYSVELTKSFEKLNSLYLLWKEMRRLYHTDVANKIIEMHISGDIYIHDLHSVNKPYSYYKNTSITIKHNNNTSVVTMEYLFDQYSSNIIHYIDYDEIIFDDIEVLDINGYVPLSRIIRHKRHNELLKIESKDGRVIVVTEDHPVILKDLINVDASNVKIGDELIVNNSIVLDESINVSDDEAYILGFWIGDGCYSGKGSITFYQKNIENSKIYSMLQNYYDVKLSSDRKCIIHSTELFKDFMKCGKVSHTKCLPQNIHHWPISAIKNFIAGLIDAEGTVQPNGCIVIRMSAYALLQGLRDIIELIPDFKHVRLSFYEHIKSKAAYNLNYDMFRLSFRAPIDMILMSEKMTTYKDQCMNVVNKDGRFEGSTIYKISTLKQNEEYVYDITTESGHFISGGVLVHNCFNFSTYDIMSKGLPMITKIKSIEPKHLYSFKSQLEQFIVIASNGILGASGVSDLLIVMSYYVKNILATMSDAHFSFKDEAAVWTYVRETITSLIYTLNQPFRGGIQCVTEATEIYTPDGFKHYSDLTVGDLVCTFDINTHEFDFQPIQKMNVSKYSGTLDVYGKQHVTPNHKVLVNTSPDVYELIVSEDIEGCAKIPQVGCNGYYMFVADNVTHVKESMEYDGIIWCPTTKAGVVVFKNEDEVFVSGNSSFTNVSIFDSNFLKDMSAMYIFPDGSTPDISIIQKLQRIYLEVMNENMRRTAITFPVKLAA